MSFSKSISPWEKIKHFGRTPHSAELRNSKQSNLNSKEDLEPLQSNQTDKKLPFTPLSTNSNWKSLLSKEENERLEALKQKLKDKFNIKNPGSAAANELFCDSHLIQFIVSSNTVDSAYKTYLNQLQMYSDLNINDIPYSSIYKELDRGYYKLCGLDYSGRPIAILQQSKVDGNVDYAVRVKTAILCCEAIYDLDIRFMKVGISLFCDLSNIGWKNMCLKYQRFIYSGLQDATQFLPGEVYLYKKPSIFSLAFKISKPFIREQYKIYGEKILNDKGGVSAWFCDQKQLSPEYGGTTKYDLSKIVKSYIQKRYLKGTGNVTFNSL